MEAKKEIQKIRDASEVLKPGTTLSEKTSIVNSMPGRLKNDLKIAREKAHRLKIPFVDPLRAAIEPSALTLLGPEMAFRRQALPIRVVDNILLVAMTTPEEPVAIKSLELLTGFKVRPAVAPKTSLIIALKKYYRDGYEEKPDVKAQKPKIAQKTNAKISKGDKSTARTISVISNKGGVGKTHFSINMAYCLAKKGAKVLLIDADLGNADVSNKLGIFPKNHLMDFLEKNKNMDALLFPTKYGFDLIASSYGEFKLANLYYAQKVKFINHFKKISQRYDFAIFDLGAGISRIVMDFALAADHTIIVTTPQDFFSGYACTKAGFSRFKEIEERLAEKLKKYEPHGIFAPMLVVNQVNNLRQGYKLFETLSKTADEKINSRESKYRIEPEYLGAIPYERVALRAAEMKKRPLLVAAPRIKASQCIKHITTRFFYPETTYAPKFSFKHPLSRFAAILSQKE
jgi:flagellar biosynthesis protein FlhG